MGGPTVVLVHGAGGGAWVWESLARELDGLGVAHVEIDLPSSESEPAPDAGVVGDAAAVRELLDSRNWPSGARREFLRRGGDFGCRS